jgi:stringent starvation protein B
LHDWCTDNGFTPYLAVYVDQSVQVPREYVKNNEIVLNVSFEASSALQLGNEFIEFKARFGGVARDICVPVDHVIAIYARENGQGMAFPVPTSLGGEGVDAPAATDADGTPPEAPVMLAPAAEERAPTALKLARSGKAEGALTSAKGDKPVTNIKSVKDTGDDKDPTDPTTPGGNGGRPALRRIK